MHSLCLLLTSCLAGADPGFASTIPDPSGAVPVGYCCPQYNPPISVVYPYNIMPVGNWGSSCASGNCGSGGCAAPACNDCCEPKKCCFCRFKEWLNQRHCCKQPKCCAPKCCEKPKCCEPKCCEPKCCEKPKNDCCKPSFCDRLKACFTRCKKDDCCDTCNNYGAAPAAAGKAPEPIKMPKEEKKEGAFELLPGREAPLPKGPPVATPTSNPIPF
jgi:hypothetical protein